MCTKQNSGDMKFTLIHYTEGWHTGATVNLSTLPPLGSLVKANDNSSEDFEDIFYVDNIMLADGGDNYLFVRPYVGYGIMAPLTEADRISETIKEAKKEIIKKLDEIDDRVTLLPLHV